MKQPLSMYSGHVYRSPGKMIAMVMGLANYYKPYLFTNKHHEIIIMIESQRDSVTPFKWNSRSEL